MKKILAMLLVLVMVFALVACKPSTSTDDTTAPADETTAPVDETEAPVDETEAPEAVRPEDHVDLSIWFHGSNVTPDASAKVMEAVNAYLDEKLNVTLTPIWGTWGDFDTSVTTALAGSDDTDIVFTCNWSGNEYNTYARDGYYVRLDGEDDLLGNYGAALKDVIPQAIWDSAKTNGEDGYGIYGVPGMKDTATSNTWDVNVTALEEAGYSFDDVKGGIDFYSDEFVNMLQAVKDLHPDWYPLNIEPMVLERMITGTSIVSGDNTGLLSYYYDLEHPANDIGNKIENKYGTEAYAKFAARVYEMSQKGFIAPALQNVDSSNDTLQAAQSEAAYLFGTQSYSYGYEHDTSAARKIHVEYVPTSAPYMDATSGQGAMMAINVNSKNPERAMMFLALLNTDSELMTMMNYGTEGFTYTKNDDGTITFDADARGTYSPWTNGMGNVRLLPPTADQGLSFWADFAAFYEGAEQLPYGAFVFDHSEIDDEYAACSNVFAKYGFLLDAGAVDPATELPKFLEELDAAGMADIVAAANAQMEAFIAG